MIIYFKIFAFNTIKKVCSELFSVNTVAFEYKEYKLKIFGSFDKNKTTVLSFY